jgi:medium-chain acyl-[acyl-carrier-protein] hydrolase
LRATGAWNTPPASWVAGPRRSHPGRIRLVCFPCAGGGASSYYSWSAALAPDIDVCAIQLPGREARVSEQPFTRLDALLERLTAALVPHLDGPFALFGHSMGALLAYETARQLRRSHGLTAVHVFASGRRAPGLPPSEPPVHAWPDRDLLRHLGDLNGIPDEIFRDRAFMNEMLPVFRADLTLCETYQYRQDLPLTCDLTVLGGDSDPHVPAADLEAWHTETTGRCQVMVLPGDHFFIRTASRAVLDVVTGALRPYGQGARAAYRPRADLQDRV